MDHVSFVQITEPCLWNAPCSECTDQFFRRIWPMRRIHLPCLRQMLQPWRSCSVRLQWWLRGERKILQK